MENPPVLPPAVRAAGPRLSYRVGELVALTGIARVTIHNLEKRGKFPRGTRVTSRLVLYPADQVEAFIAGQWAEPNSDAPPDEGGAA